MNDQLERLLIDPGASIRTAMQAIEHGACEIALVVDEERRLVAAVTDGDIRRALLAGHSTDDPVIDHASRNPFSVGTDASRAEVLDLMQARTIAQVPIVDSDGALVGLHLMREQLQHADLANTAVVLAGGRGTRLGALTEQVPKPMVPVAGRPILERILLHLVGAGVRRIILSVGYLADVIEKHFGDGDDFGCRIEYVREDPDRPLGTGGPLRLVADLPSPPKDPLLLLNGDLITDVPIVELLRHHESSGSVITMTYWEHYHEVPYGVLELEHSGDVTDLVEKPIASWRINAGVYVLDPMVTDRVPDGTDFPVTDLVVDCLRRGERVSALQIDGEWIDIGRPDELRRARGEL